MNVTTKVVALVSTIFVTILPGPSHAAVLGSNASGFEVREAIHISASAANAYAALLLPSRWWSSEHTFSGNAANLALDARPGGCWCESLPNGGFVQHMTVVYAAPGKMLRLRGALGPFQGLGVEGALTLEVKDATDGADVTFTYAIGGYVHDGFDSLSKIADTVLAAQIDGLKKYLERAAPRGA